MRRLFRHVDGDRHPFHQSLMEVKQARHLVNDMENHQVRRLDEVRLHLVRQLDVVGVLRILGVLRRDDCLT